jgi:hypothetical protein
MHPVKRVHFLSKRRYSHGSDGPITSASFWTVSCTDGPDATGRQAMLIGGRFRPPALKGHGIMSVPGHALRCGPETSVTSPLWWRWIELSGHERTYIQPSRPWECGNPEGISKECGKGGKPASWLSMLSILCHFHDLLFARHCWINRNATQRHAPRSPRTKIPAHWRKRRAIRTGYLAS